MKNKGFVIFFVLVYQYFLVMLVESLGATTVGGTLIEIPTDPTFVDFVVSFFKIFIGLLTFSISVDGMPDIIAFFGVYIPLVILLIAIASFVRGD